MGREGRNGTGMQEESGEWEWRGIEKKWDVGSEDRGWGGGGEGREGEVGREGMDVGKEARCRNGGKGYGKETGMPEGTGVEGGGREAGGVGGGVEGGRGLSRSELFDMTWRRHDFVVNGSPNKPLRATDRLSL